MSVWYILRKLKPITEKRWEKSYKEMCTPCAVGKHPGCSFSISPFRRKDMRLIYLCFVHCFDIFQVHPEFLAFFSFFAVHLQDSVMSLFQLLAQKKHHTKTFRQRTTTTVKITSLAFTGQSGMGRVKESSYFITIQVRQGEKCVETSQWKCAALSTFVDGNKQVKAKTHIPYTVLANHQTTHCSFLNYPFLMLYELILLWVNHASFAGLQFPPVLVIKTLKSEYHMNVWTH